VKQWCLRKVGVHMSRSRLKVNSAKFKVDISTDSTSVNRSKAPALRPAFVDAGVLNVKPNTVSATAISPNNI
jgi:hypothetical protein